MAKLKMSQDIFDLIYPVGSIYMSINSANPSTLFGGTWTSWGAGRVPIGVNSSDTDFNTVEKTGGSKTHSHTQGSTGSTKLSLNQIPSHTHSYYWGSGGSSQVYSVKEVLANVGNLNHYAYTSGSGGGKGHTHTNPNTASSSSLSPYITCYMWKRTA